MVERNRLGGWGFVGGDNLQVVHSLIVADDEVSDSCTAEVIHLFDTCLI